MSILILQLPARRRHLDDAALAQASPARDASAAALRRRVGEDLLYALSSDGGLSVLRHGVSAPMLLPRATTVVAVVAAADLSWHRIKVPKAPLARMREALIGVLEEALLDEPADVHLALAPQAKAGSLAWVAVCSRAWLAQRLEQLEQARVHVDRVVPSAWPDDPPSAYFREVAGQPPADTLAVECTWSTADGVSTWPLRGSYARALLPEPLPLSARFFATPAVAAAAERWLGAPVSVQTEVEHLVQAARSLWNLRQFDLAARHPGWGAVTDRWHDFIGPAWRPVRVGLIALLVAQIVGLNLWAWHQNAGLRARQQSMVNLLRSTHPQVVSVIDAPVQMRRENDTLRAAAGQLSEDDLEPLMQVAASAWPPGQALTSFQYYAGTLTLAVAGWGRPQIDQFRSDLQAAGFSAEEVDERINISRQKRL